MDYEIRVLGQLDAGWSDWFQGLEVRTKTLDDGQTLTRLTGPIHDQAALRGIVNKLWDLNLTLVSVISNPAEEGKP
jgi:hypothetical protein